MKISGKNYFNSSLNLQGIMLFKQLSTNENEQFDTDEYPTSSNNIDDLYSNLFKFFTHVTNETSDKHLRHVLKHNNHIIVDKELEEESRNYEEEIIKEDHKKIIISLFHKFLEQTASDDLPLLYKLIDEIKRRAEVLNEKKPQEISDFHKKVRQQLHEYLEISGDDHENTSEETIHEHILDTESRIDKESRKFDKEKFIINVNRFKNNIHKTINSHINELKNRKKLEDKLPRKAMDIIREWIKNKSNEKLKNAYYVFDKIKRNLFNIIYFYISLPEKKNLKQQTTQIHLDILKKDVYNHFLEQFENSLRSKSTTEFFNLWDIAELNKSPDEEIIGEFSRQIIWLVTNSISQKYGTLIEEYKDNETTPKRYCDDTKDFKDVKDLEDVHDWFIEDLYKFFKELSSISVFNDDKLSDFIQNLRLKIACHAAEKATSPIKLLDFLQDLKDPDQRKKFEKILKNNENKMIQTFFFSDPDYIKKLSHLRFPSLEK